jgi:hypothetical protein
LDSSAAAEITQQFVKEMPSAEEQAEHDAAISEIMKHRRR